MLATVVTANQGSAQVLFLIAAILAVVATVVCLMEKAWPAALSVAAVAFVAFGLLFHA